MRGRCWGTLLMRSGLTSQRRTSGRSWGSLCSWGSTNCHNSINTGPPPQPLPPTSLPPPPPPQQSSARGRGRRRGGTTAHTGGRSNVSWVPTTAESDTPTRMPPFTGTPGPRLDLPDDPQPLFLFRQLLSEDLISLIIDETNRYVNGSLIPRLSLIPRKYFTYDL